MVTVVLTRATDVPVGSTIAFNGRLYGITARHHLQNVERTAVVTVVFYVTDKATNRGSMISVPSGSDIRVHRSDKER